jgi:hypothetical protein
LYINLLGSLRRAVFVSKESWRLHDSESDTRIECLFDAGFTWTVDGELNGWKASGEAPIARQAALALAGTAFAEFPRSTVAGWWRERRYRRAG